MNLFKRSRRAKRVKAAKRFFGKAVHLPEQLAERLAEELHEQMPRRRRGWLRSATRSAARPASGGLFRLGLWTGLLAGAAAAFVLDEEPAGAGGAGETQDEAWGRAMNQVSEERARRAWEHALAPEADRTEPPL